MSSGLHVALVVAALTLAACSARTPMTEVPPPSGDVRSGMIEPNPAARMQLSDNEVFIPGELSNPEVVPIYPEALLAQRLPDQHVCIQFVVERDGSVRDASPLLASPGCAASEEDVPPEFTEAALAAVRQWDFFSFLRCSFPPGTPDAQKCNGPGARTEQVAVSLAYRFIFSVRDGRGRVEQQRTAN